jgi:excisionase family DNA binding protein
MGGCVDLNDMIILVYMDEKLLTIGQAAEYLGVSQNTLRRWDESGKLIAIKKEGGVHRYYREKDLEIFASDLIKFAFDWIENGTEFPGTFYCPTSSIFNARLTKMQNALIEKPGFEQLFSLITLITGEIGDNSFAHNLGKWPDTAGIFFGYDLEKRIIVLADRGLGILETLRQIRPELPSHVAAVQVAFTEFISGRAPEKRGNGLKLVREVVTDQPIDLFYQSGDAEVRMNGSNKVFRVTRGQRIVRGCLAKIEF